MKLDVRIMLDSFGVGAVENDIVVVLERTKGSGINNIVKILTLSTGIIWSTYGKILDDNSAKMNS